MLSNALASSSNSPVAWILPTRAERSPFFSDVAADQIVRRGLSTMRVLISQASDIARRMTDAIKPKSIASALAASFKTGARGVPTRIRTLPLGDSKSGT